MDRYFWFCYQTGKQPPRNVECFCCFSHECTLKQNSRIVPWYILLILKEAFRGHWGQRTFQVEFWDFDFENLYPILKHWSILFRLIRKFQVMVYLNSRGLEAKSMIWMLLDTHIMICREYYIYRDNVTSVEELLKGVFKIYLFLLWKLFLA